MINTRTRSIKKIRPLEDKARTKKTLEYKANMYIYKHDPPKKLLYHCKNLCNSPKLVKRAYTKSKKNSKQKRLIYQALNNFRNNENSTMLIYIAGKNCCKSKFLNEAKIVKYR